MGYRKVREFKQRLRDYAPGDDDPAPRGYYSAPEDDDVDQPDGQLVTRAELTRLSGCGGATIQRLADMGVIPRAVGRNSDGKAVWNLADPQLAEWVAALQRAGYHQRPAEATKA